MLLRQAISKGGILNEVLSLNAQESLWELTPPLMRQQSSMKS